MGGSIFSMDTTTKPETIKPETVADYLKMATTLKQKGKLNEAASLYKQALEIEPDNGNAHRALANYYFTEKNYDLAIPHYLFLAVIEPKESLAHNRLGQIAKLQNRLPDAIASYTHAIELSPDAPGP